MGLEVFCTKLCWRLTESGKKETEWIAHCQKGMSDMSGRVTLIPTCDQADLKMDPPRKNAPSVHQKLRKGRREAFSFNCKGPVPLRKKS
jgi:hypothetical protein